MESFLADLKKDVQCSLCNDTLIEPKIMKCFHTFCKLCLKRHAELIEEANVFKCPKCLSETSLPELSSVDDLKPSLLHSRMLKVLEFAESEKVCSVSESHSPASFHCFDCNRSMCDECEKNHSVFIKDHKIISLAESKEEDIKLMLNREDYCVHHSAKIMEMFCNDCEQVICFECFKHGHDGHLTITLAKFTSTNKALLSEQLEQLKIREQEMERQVEIMEETNKELRTSSEKAKIEVKERLQEILDILQQNAKKLISQIDENVEKAEKMKVKGQSELDQTRGAIDYMNKLIENGLAGEVIGNKDLMNETCNKAVDSPVEQHSGIVFISNEELMKQVNSELGSIQVTYPTDHTMSSVGVDSGLQALKKAKMNVLLKTKNKNINDNPSDVIDVKIHPENNVKTDENNVRKVGEIQVEFMPKVPGQLTAEVKVNGNHVSNSPLVMNVKPQQIRITREFKMKGIKTGLQNYSGIAVNKQNSRIAVAGWSSHCVHVFNTDGDLLLTYGSQGNGQGQLSSPHGLAFLNETDLVISDRANRRICIVNTTTGTLVKTFGNQGNGNGKFLSAYGVQVDDGCNIIVSDHGNHRVQVFTKDGDYQYQFGLTNQEKVSPVSTVTHRGLFYVSDYNNNVIHVFEKKCNVPTRISTIGGKGSADGQLSKPWGLAIDNDHNLLVCDRGNNRIQKFTLGGRLVGITSIIKDPRNIAVLTDGRLLVSTDDSGVFFVE